MASVPSELQYTKEHEWLKEVGPSKFRIGITDYAQGALGDIVYVQLPKVGEAVTAGKVCGEIESTKSVSEIYSPLSGKVIAVNSSLDATPEAINASPYGDGWIAEIEIDSNLPSEGILTAEQYSNLTA